MSMHLAREISALKRMILSLSAVVEENVRKAVWSIERLDAKLAQEVIETDLEIDRREVEVEEACLKTLALHQPVAVDLRFIVAVLKINNDLERIGDLAVNIAGRSLFLCEQPPRISPFDFSELCRKALDMLRISLDSLMNMDSIRANKVLILDDEIDEINRQVFARTFEMISQSPQDAEALISYMNASRVLERIADHATNIAEDVIYMNEGWIARHGAAAEIDFTEGGPREIKADQEQGKVETGPDEDDNHPLDAERQKDKEELGEDSE
jgi:phosphate transport system protein